MPISAAFSTCSGVPCPSTYRRGAPPRCIERDVRPAPASRHGARDGRRPSCRASRWRPWRRGSSITPRRRGVAGRGSGRSSGCTAGMSACRAPLVGAVTATSAALAALAGAEGSDSSSIASRHDGPRRRRSRRWRGPPALSCRTRSPARRGCPAPRGLASRTPASSPRCAAVGPHLLRVGAERRVVLRASSAAMPKPCGGWPARATLGSPCGRGFGTFGVVGRDRACIGVAVVDYCAADGVARPREGRRASGPRREAQSGQCSW